ncbi:MAG TPA: hypothetical protein VJI32_06310 [Candidatus Nanoarchaeia archaeon]|nr:hypothetical protein [Candidatus Nanoarchaeia archaeon]
MALLYFSKRRKLIKLAERWQEDLTRDVQDLEQLALELSHTEEFFIGMCDAWDRTNIKATSHLKKSIPSFLSKAWKALRDSKKQLAQAAKIITEVGLDVNKIFGINLLFSNISAEEREKIKELVTVTSFEKEVLSFLDDISGKSLKLLAEIRLLRVTIRGSSVSELIGKKEKMLAMIHSIREHAGSLKELSTTRFRAIFAQRSAPYSFLVSESGVGSTTKLRNELALYGENRKIRKEGILFFHMTDYFPDKGILWPLMAVAGQIRDTVHFTVNGPVGAHMEENWDGKKYCVIIPFASFPVRRIVGFAGYDTYVHGAVKLKHALIIAQEKVLSEDLARQGKNTEEVIELLRNIDIQVEFVSGSVYNYADHVASKIYRTPLMFGGSQTYVKGSSFDLSESDREFAKALGAHHGQHAFHPFGRVEDATKEVIGVAYLLRQRDSYTSGDIFFALHLCFISPDHILGIAEEHVQDQKARRAVANLLSQYEKILGPLVEQLKRFEAHFKEVLHKHRQLAPLAEDDYMMFSFVYYRFGPRWYLNEQKLTKNYPRILAGWPKLSRQCIDYSILLLDLYNQIIATEKKFTFDASEMSLLKEALRRRGVQVD